MIFPRIASAALFAVAATPAVAHTGGGDVHGFWNGFMHPVSGLDHALAMVAVGLFASLLGSRALWAVPASFVAMMLAGGALGMTGLALPAVELAIALSIIVIGAATALGHRWPTAAAMALVGVFALFHGHAHGAEMPAGASALAYGLGFASGTALLHVAGLALGLAARRPALVRLQGAAATLCGLVLLAA